MEGDQKERRQETIRNARILENSWDIFNLCKQFWIENETDWAKRSTEEIKRIREKEKRERFEMIEEKRKKY